MHSLPRDQTEAGPQSLLAIMLGDYTWDRVTVPIPTTIFVRMLMEFGLTEASARIALGRVSKRGLLTRHRSGRTVCYAISPQYIARHQLHAAQIFGTGADAEGWDGKWTVVLTSVPESQRELRAQLRARLVARGFAPLYAAVWIRPNAEAQEAAAEVLASLPAIQATVVVGEVAPPSAQGSPLAAYALDDVVQAYRGFADSFGGVHASLQAHPGKGPRAGPQNALVLRTRLMDAWRTAIKADPRLPSSLLPQDFPLATARRIFVETYDGLGALACARLREIVADVDPAIAQRLQHRRSADMCLADGPSRGR